MFVFFIEIIRVSQIDEMHATAQISQRCFQEQMIMVRHKNITMNTDIKFIDRILKVFDKTIAIAIYQKNRLSSITPGGNVIESARIFYSQCSSHGDKPRYP